MTNGIAVIDPAKLALIKGSFGKNGLPLPFVTEIFLLQCHVAGTGYKDVESIEPGLNKGHVLTFKRDANNKYDKLAIAIYDEAGNNIGYVPRDKNEVLARLMDGGKLIFGKIKEKQWVNSWLQIDIKIYMRDF